MLWLCEAARERSDMQFKLMHFKSSHLKSTNLKPRWTVMAVLVSAVLLSSGWAQDSAADPVVLTVDETNFTLSEFDDRFDFLRG